VPLWGGAWFCSEVESAVAAIDWNLGQCFLAADALR
jgi:hypothetical protein